MSKNSLDKQLEERRKKTDGDFEHKIACCKGWWKVFWVSPMTYTVAGGIAVGYICLGVYFDWNSKMMVAAIANWGIPSLITGLVLENRKKDKNQ